MLLLLLFCAGGSVGDSHGILVDGGSVSVRRRRPVHRGVEGVWHVSLRHCSVEGGGVVVDLGAGQGGSGRDLEGPHSAGEIVDALCDQAAMACRTAEGVGVVPVIEVELLHDRDSWGGGGGRDAPVGWINPDSKTGNGTM